MKSYDFSSSRFRTNLASGGKTSLEALTGGVQLTAPGQFSCLWQALILCIYRLDGIIIWLPQLRKPALICTQKCIASSVWCRLSGWSKACSALGEGAV